MLVTNFILISDPLQPAECGGSRQPEEEVDHTAAARYGVFLCANEPGEQRRWPPAASVHPNCSRPAEDETNSIPTRCGGGW